MAAEWYFRVMGTEFGPLSANELVERAADGKIRPDTEVRKGEGAWGPASRVAGLFDRASQWKVGTAKTVVPPPLPNDDIGSAMRKNVSSALFGGEGLFQTRIRGTGSASSSRQFPLTRFCELN